MTRSMFSKKDLTKVVGEILGHIQTLDPDVTGLVFNLWTFRKEIESLSEYIVTEFKNQADNPSAISASICYDNKYGNRPIDIIITIRTRDVTFDLLLFYFGDVNEIHKYNEVDDLVSRTFYFQVPEKFKTSQVIQVKKCYFDWVASCIGTCMREKYSMAFIVIPKDITIRELLVNYEQNKQDLWEITPYVDMLELYNTQRGYTISIVNCEAFNLLHKSTTEADRCFVPWHVSESMISMANDIENGHEYVEDEKSDPEMAVISNDVKSLHESIPDSGNEPRVFESGFQRDSDLGKAKWSLLPPHVWSIAIPTVGDYFRNFLMTGNVNELENALTFCMKTHGIKLMCDRYHGGAEKYGYFNWAKLGPLSAYLDSVGRHLWAMTDWGSIEKDPESTEDHIGAVMWGLGCMIHLLHLVEDGVVSKELIDIPAYLDLVR